MTGPMTIHAIFDAFLAEQRARLSERTYANYENTPCLRNGDIRGHSVAG